MMYPLLLILLSDVQILEQATPRLSEDKVKQCVDPKLNDEYPPKAVAKVHYSILLCLCMCNLVITTLS